MNPAPPGLHDPAATVVAVATPPGRGGIGCLRLSGPEAPAIAARLFDGPAPPAGSLAFGRFLGRDGAAVDHGYLVLFAAERSYTGEPAAELWTHGSPAVLEELLAAAVAHGAALAGRGEFTYRALRHGRLDLARAEAVRDLIAARTLLQARAAFAQAAGSLTRRLEPLREALTDLAMRAEAAVEFVDEAETHLAPGGLERGIAAAEAVCGALRRGARAGRLVREGASLVITGTPNVGKSSLFNRLLERDRAIVAADPGTTRDTLEETLDIGGVPVRLVDTAGLREAADAVEGEGIRRALDAAGVADLILHVADDPGGLAAAPAGAEMVVNKADLRPCPRRELPPGAHWVSARTGEGIDALRERLRARLLGAAPLEAPVVTNVRHAAALEACAAALARAREALASGYSEEIVVEELRAALDAVGSVTGAVTSDEVLHRIFATFCIGK